jgi:2-oxoglutarate ferredoxin oxidoreductase subunit gamma
MTEKMIVAGFGGQGIILAGKLIAHAGMLEGLYVSHIPSYGAEMRGGTANCAVTLSDMEVASPLVSHPTTVIVLNTPSLSKFESRLASGGTLLVNSSLIGRKTERGDVSASYVPANNLAEEAGSGRAANMVMVGAFIAVRGILSLDRIKDSLDQVISRRNLALNDINRRALDLGYGYVKEGSAVPR